ncbi:hypothetical protein AHAS_Ahas01G0257500 [Arachis hypogaea]
MMQLLCKLSEQNHLICNAKTNFSFRAQLSPSELLKMTSPLIWLISFLSLTLGSIVALLFSWMILKRFFYIFLQFAKDSGKYIEEKKLRVVLISPSSSPVLLPVNGEAKQESNKVPMEKDRVPSGVENIPPPLKVCEEFKGLETAKNMEEDRRDEDVVARHSENENVPDIKPENDAAQLNSAEEYEQLKSRLSIMDTKLRAADVTILKLDEEMRMNTQEKDLLRKELEDMRRKVDMRRVQAGGFPLLFVCMVALVSVVLGYYIHP